MTHSILNNSLNNCDEKKTVGDGIRVTESVPFAPSLLANGGYNVTNVFKLFW